MYKGEGVLAISLGVVLGGVLSSYWRYGILMGVTVAAATVPDRGISVGLGREVGLVAYPRIMSWK